MGATAISLLAPLCLSSGSAAYADACQTSGCYAVMAAGAAQDAAGVDIKEECMYGSLSFGQFINWELWMIMTGKQDWVEAGLTYGYLQAPTNGNNFSWFWADNRPGDDYNEHFISAGWSNTKANVAIYHVSGGSWSVQRNGTQVGESTNNVSTAVLSEAGAESGLSTNNIYAFADNFQYRHTGGAWQGANPNSGFYSLTPPFSGSVYAGTTTGAASTVWANKCTPSEPNHGTPRVASQSGPAPGAHSIVQTARRLAALNGDSHPTGVTYVTTTRAKANHLLGATVDSDQAVYLVQLHGHFNGATASHPQGSAAPHGTVMTVTIDAANGRITDWGISNSAVPLNRLGEVRRAD
jgi:hypothetical protein